MAERDRSEGWQHAKLSGHSNEEKAKNLVETNKDVQERILDITNNTGKKIVSVEIGGLYEENVPSILGGTTKSKTDMRILLNDGSLIKISIKKSYGGQVYLIGTGHFIEGFEKQYSKTIPANVKRAIKLFWGDTDDGEMIIKQYSPNDKIRAYELHKGCRLTHATLNAYDSNLDECLIAWFKDNIFDVYDFCFSKGLAERSQDWADVIWYINLVDDEELDVLFDENLVRASLKNEDVYYGDRIGGTTIQLPFGFVQWHQHQMQFHHSFSKLSECCYDDY